MSIKIKLGERPKTFKHKVKAKMLDGEMGVVEMTYRYRTRTEFGEFLDKLFEDARNARAPDDDDIIATVTDALKKTKETNADYILKIAEGWNLDAEFNRDNIGQLCDEYPGIALAIINDYRAAITEGRLGN
jgi:hypothetical protein